MGISVEVEACGPLRGTSLQLPERGIVAVIGPNLSGKSLLVSSLGSLAIACALTADWRVLGKFSERLAGAEGAWSDLYRVEVDGANVLDPLAYFETALEYRSAEEYLSRLDEVVRRESNQALGGVRDYLLRTAFAAELCLSRGVKPWNSERPEVAALQVAAHAKAADGAFLWIVNASLPTADPARAGAKALADAVSVRIYRELVGVNVSNPLEFIKRYSGWISDTPSSAFVRTVLRNFRYSPDPEAYGELRSIFCEAWSEISGMEISEEDVSFYEHMVEGLYIGVKDRRFPWYLSSSGVMNLLAHWLILSVLPLFRQEGVSPVICVEEPESNLDPYSAYRLPYLYSIIVRKYNVLIVLSSHSEMLAKGLEDAVADGRLSHEEVSVYETRGEGDHFKLVRCAVREDGRIEDSRFTRIARRLFEAELKRLGEAP